MDKLHKISFCTVCMNRLHHLQQTLPQNIADNVDYPNLKFVIVDYNSNDGLEEWIKINMASFIVSGKLVFYRTQEPLFFHRSHSRNLSFKLAEGEILCNIDADNFTGKEFAAYINKQFNTDEALFLTPIDFHKMGRNYPAPGDTLGRACFTKKSFLEIKGYSEQMSTHGFQDYDFTNRLELAGYKRILIDRPEFLKAITHENTERFQFESINTSLEKILCRYISPGESEIIYLYRENVFHLGNMVDANIEGTGRVKSATRMKAITDQYSIAQIEWLSGKWETVDDITIQLKLEEGDRSISLSSRPPNPRFNINSDVFHLIEDEETISKLKIFNTHMTNYNIMKNNFHQRIIVTNNGAFGKATVYKNMDMQSLLLVE